MSNENAHLRKGNESIKRRYKALLPVLAAAVSLMMAGCGSGASQAVQGNSGALDGAAVESAGAAGDEGENEASQNDDGKKGAALKNGKDSPKAQEEDVLKTAGNAGNDGEDTTAEEAEGGMEENGGSGKDSGGMTDLEQLMKKNPDVCAWLEITGTDLSFPVCQSAEDEYFYLSHGLDKKEDSAGCIYTEYYNSRAFTDPNTVIYGRNVEGRFAGLHQYQDRDFFDTYREVKIYLKDKTLTYEIFAAYEYDDRHLIKIYDFWDRDIFTAYLKDVFSQRGMDTYLDDSIEVTAEDRIITLSTGVTGADDRRYLVQAVLENER